MTAMAVAMVAGVGPGLGRAVAERFAAEGARVALLARDPAKLDRLAAARPDRLKPYVCDITDPAAVAEAFARVDRDLGTPDCVVFNAGTYQRGAVVDTDPAEFERCWRVSAFGGFLVGQAAAKAMLARGQGTILFTGATASLRGGANFVNLASPKFALRALAQSMARELGPQGIHVAHIIVDGQIASPRTAHLAGERAPDGLLSPEAIAEAYYGLYCQNRSAWTHEIDLRPWVEKF